MSSFSFIFAQNVVSLSSATLRCAFCGAFRWTSTAPPGSFYLYAPAGVTKGQALNTVPADNRQGHRSLATGGPLLGGLTPTDWTRVLYHGATHRRAGGGGGERTNRQGGGRKGGTETQKLSRWNTGMQCPAECPGLWRGRGYEEEAEAEADQEGRTALVQRYL